jgi:uncharacterized protein (DUF3084 family)
MMGIRFENSLSIGNLITLGALAVGGVYALSEMRADLRTQRENTKRVETQIETVLTDAAAREARIRALELGAGRTEEKLTNILQILSRMERQMDNNGGTRP